MYKHVKGRDQDFTK